MAEKRAIGLVHHRARLFARDVVGFGSADCDQPFLVPGHCRHDIAVALNGILEEIENEPALQDLARGRDAAGSSEAENRTDGAAPGL